MRDGHGEVRRSGLTAVADVDPELVLAGSAILPTREAAGASRA